jgi:Skp family chaperone for outer membrane proteins
MKAGFTTSLALAPMVIIAAVQGTPPPSSGVRFIRAQTVMSESTEAKAELGRFQDLQRQKSTELRAKQQALDVVRGQILQEADPAARAKLVEEEKRLRTDFEQATVAAQTDLQARQRQMQASLQARLKIVLDELLKDQPVDVVLNADTTLVWGRTGSDLTAAVVARLNAGYGRGGAPPDDDRPR